MSESNDFRFGLISWEEAEALSPPTVEEPEPVKLPVLYEHSWYSASECCIRVYACEDEEWGAFYFEMDCEGPPVNHWLEYCFETTGSLKDVMDLTSHRYPFSRYIEQFLLEHGIAPGQPFYLWMEFESWTDYWGEYDERVGYAVVGIVPWDNERVMTAWEAYFGRKHLMRWMDVV